MFSTSMRMSLNVEDYDTQLPVIADVLDEESDKKSGGGIITIYTNAQGNYIALVDSNFTHVF